MSKHAGSREVGEWLVSVNFPYLRKNRKNFRVCFSFSGSSQGFLEVCVEFYVGRSRYFNAISILLGDGS